MAENEKVAEAKQANLEESKMAEEKQTDVDNEGKSEVAYRLVPPDDGWGYVIVAAMTVMIVSTTAPMGAFGIIFGDFLKSVGDETTGITMANAMLNTISSFAGLATNFLLKKFSYRKVGLLGAFLFSGGAFGIVLSQSMIQFILFFGCVQGIGFGLLFPASCTAFNCYFDKKLNLMMGLSQSVMAASNMAFPPIATLMMSHLGFRLSVIVIAAISLVNIPAMAALQPIKWHLKMVPVSTDDTAVTINKEKEQEKDNKRQGEPLMHKKSLNNNQLTDKVISNKLLDNVIVYQYEKRTSIVSLGEKAASVTAEDFDFERSFRKEEKSIWQSLSDLMDMSLLKDWRYLNISIGLSLGYTGDLAFVTLIPLLLTNSGFSREDVAYSMMIFFGLDLAGRVYLTFTSSFCKGITNRQLFLGGTLLSACFRVAFVATDTYVGKVATLGCLGFLRSHIQTPFSLVISENYPKNFSTAFSLLMVVVGCVSLVVGPLLSIIKRLTGSDVMVCHLLTLAFVICSVSWLLELFFAPKKKRVAEK